MMNLGRVLATIFLAATLAACSSQRGAHHIPVTRDYGQIEPSDIHEADAAVAEAHRVGAQHGAAYDFFSATFYLDMAHDSREEGDRVGAWDYAAIAKDYAENAVQSGAIIEDAGEYVMPETEDELRAEFDRLRALHSELDQEKASMVAPFVYAHATSELSRAEHEIHEARQWTRAGVRLASVQSDIDTILAQDTDGDGVNDMADGAPWAPEDKDDFEDEDGVPDPDNDKDGILDGNDLAPNEPETINRWHDHDGAPDEYPTLESIQFASGSSAFTSETRGYLRGIAHILQEWPELKLSIRGHTDNTHSPRYNQDLSRRRAELIHAYLVSAGAPEDRMSVSFYGETRALNDNQTAADHAENRRVELVFE